MVRSGLTTNSDAMWIGGSTGLATGVWRWVDTEVFTWHNWDPAQPDGPDNQWCLVYDGQSEWQDKGCDDNIYPFMCQSKPGMYLPL